MKYKFKLAGVTFNNRQNVIKSTITKYGNNCEVELNFTKFKDDLCIEIFIKGTERMVGFCPSKQVKDIYDKGEPKIANVSFYSGGDPLTYGGEVTLVFEDKE